MLCSSTPQVPKALAGAEGRRERPHHPLTCTLAGLAALLQKQSPTERRSKSAGERPRPLPPCLLPCPPSARTVDKSPLQQPLIKDVAGGGCAPQTNVPDALLHSALVFTESQAGIRFPPQPPTPRRGGKEPSAASQSWEGRRGEKSHQMERFSPQFENVGVNPKVT